MEYSTIMSRMFGMAKAAKNFLITGANRGLGLELACQLAAAGQEVIVTARPSKMDELNQSMQAVGVKPLAVIPLDLLQGPEKNVLGEILDNLPPITSAVHCASPYWTEPLMKTSPFDLRDLHNVMLNDTLLLHALAQQMMSSKTAGVLAVTGAVIGMPNINFRGMMGLVKAHQRQLANVLEHEAEQARIHNGSGLHVRHFNLGSFRPGDAANNDPQNFIPESFVAQVIIDALNNPLLYNPDTNLVSPSDEQKYKVSATVTPQTFQSEAPCPTKN